MAGGEVIEAVGFAKSVVCKVSDVITRHRAMKGAVKSGLNYIRREMNMLIFEIEAHEEKNQGATHEGKIVLLKELAYDMEDFIDLTWVPGASGLLFTALGMDPSAPILQKIDYFKDSIQTVRNWQPDAGSGSGGDGGAANTWSCPSAASAHPCKPEAAILKGICKRRDEVGRLLSAAEGKELKVISIVGCPGVGKTTLAGAVYDQCRASGDYDYVAWVVASECRDPEDLLGKVLKEAHRTAQPSCGAAEGSVSDVEQRRSLRTFLHDKRYFVVIDDVNGPEMWQAIKYEFPDEGHGSKIIVTTSVHSVAAECSQGIYVYTMQCLDKDESEEVFWKTVGEEIRSPALEDASEGILKKCGGLPLALISVANFLRRRGRAERCVAGGLKTEHCKYAASAFGQKVLEGRDAEFSETNRTLVQCYNNLPGYVHRNSLLYVSVFPRERLINCNVLLRRWMAEGLVGSHGTVNDDQGAKGCLEEFIDRCIIEPVEINNARVTMCRVHSVMLEFIIHKAVSKNFVALVVKDELLSNKGTMDVRVRRLSVQDSSKKGIDDAANDIDLSAMRSLTIFGSPLLDLQASKLLRVLDLEGCKGLNNDTVLRAICKQRFLKYLILRATDVVHLPSEIKRLERLETLDIRDTGVGVLPVDVIKLPLLAHLFGRFELAPGINRDVSKQSRLQTLVGVVVTEADQSFENIILHAGKLRKVKIYQATSYSSISLNTRINSDSRLPLLRLKERFTGSKALQILSIDSSDFSTQFMSFLEAPCAITSIKLRGQLESLPDAPSLRQLAGLNKLLLISSGLSGEDLSVLQCLSCLEYLKLAEDHDGFHGGRFVVKSGGFPSLKRLCFEAPKLPQVQFHEGSMKSLTILDLLCTRTRLDLNYHLSHQTCGPMESKLAVAGLACVENLNQVILHHSTRESEMQAWTEEAIRHKNRPSVKRATPTNHPRGITANDCLDPFVAILLT